MSDTAQNGRNSPVRARTLEYKQAMKDFHTMFPTLEKNIIECVLRANAGHVDSTIDQLLQLTQDNMSQDSRSIHSFERLYHTYDGSTGNMPSELHDRLSSNEEDHLPPRYTPYFEPPPSAYTFSTQPVEPITAKARLPQTCEPKRYRDWNPPLLGALPPDFLRIVPVENHNKYKKHSSTSNHSYASRHSSSRTQQSSRRSMSNHSNARPHRDADLSQHRPLQRRRTTGEVNVVLSRTPTSTNQTQQRMVMVNSQRERTPLRQRHQQYSSPNSSNRRRSSEEESQYVEDRKFALLLQNEEFLKELRRNEQFLHELNRGSVTEDGVIRSTYSNPRDEFRPIHVDPLAEIPQSQTDQCPTPSSQGHQEDKNFKESLKHMNKSAKKSFNEIARRFAARRKSYKSMSNAVDPIFANCEEDER